MITDKRKKSIHFSEEMLSEIREEAIRLDRSISWIIQRAWKIAHAEIAKIPGTNSDLDNTGQINNR